MRIRRPVAALFVALALVGGTGTLTACGDPASTTGTPKDTAENTEGGDPADPSQGNLPDNQDSDQEDPDEGPSDN
jgi:hypothetical protein